MKRRVISLGIAVLVAIVGVTWMGTAFAETPQEGQFDPAKLRAAIESCRCSSSLMDLQSQWNQERSEDSLALYNLANRQGKVTELSRDVYWGVPLLLADTPDSGVMYPSLESGTGVQVLASSGSLMEMMTRRNDALRDMTGRE